MMISFGSNLTIPIQYLLVICIYVFVRTSRQGMIEIFLIDLLNTLKKPNVRMITRALDSLWGPQCTNRQLNDYVSFDDGRHIEALPNDYVGDNTLPRITSDESVNDNGNLLIDFCIQTGLRIANGRVGADAMEGKCTYVGSRGSSLIDYVIVSEDLLSHISDFYVSDPNILSDHCTVNFVIQNSISETKDEEVDLDISYVQTKYVWDKSLLDASKLAVSSSNIIENFDSLFENSQDVSSMDGIDNCVESFVGILDSVCEPLLEKKLPASNSNIPHKNDSNVLYNEECRLKNMIFSPALTATEIVGMMKIGFKW